MSSAHDTIVAIGSPPGSGQRGMIRLSGPKALFCATTIFTPHPPDQSVLVRTLQPGRLALSAPSSTSSRVGIPAFLLFFPAPHSYTGEEVAELHTLSNPALLTHLVQRLVESGARPAEAGEFTRRAVLHGKLDLTRAEGVAAVISAQNDAELRAGQTLLAGDLARQVFRLQAQLAETLAFVEAGIDFVDEGVGFLPPTELSVRVASLQKELAQLLCQPSSQERPQTHPRVAILGRPNAGKSSLFNALLGRTRAIASPLPGTTRDVLRGEMLLPDGQTTVELLDTAGMEAVSPSDDLETAMHTHARQAGQTADGVVWVVDLAAEVGPLPFPPSNRPTLLVGSKCDLLPPSEISRRLAAWHSPLDETPGCRPAIAFSAQTGVGLADLRRRIAELVAGDRPSLGEGRVFLTSRHRDALLRADQALRRILDMLCGSSSPCPDKVLAGPELLAVELREALDHLGRMVGATLPDDLLDVIFSRFCIGK